MGMSGLSIRGVHKNFGSVEVLKGIDIEVGNGEFLILVGSSGCGKSTLLNMVAGLESISRGEIHIGGRLVNELPPRDRDIAMVFQSYALYPSMTVRENISFGLSIRKVRAAEQKRIVDAVAETLQISHLLDRKPKQLSGGQRQRVAMGRALARDPTLFLFDEPLSNLDAQLRLEMRSEIKLMHQRLGKTICYVTHDQIEAMTLGDRIAVMKDGVVQQIGSPQEVYDRPSNMYVARFIGAPPMNFIEGELIALDGDLGLEIKTGAETKPLPLPFPNTAELRPGRTVVLGVRPERMVAFDGATGEGAFCPLTVVVDLIEPTGPDTLVFSTINGARTLSRVHPASDVRAGHSFALGLDLSRATLFDPQSGGLIAHAGDAG
jgi:multiple sugar transport system ATP-binding protein